VPKQYILQQVSEEVNRKLAARNTTVQLLTLYIDPQHHNAQHYRWRDRQTDGQMTWCQELNLLHAVRLA